MIIDRLLDRKNGEPYKAKAFYDYCTLWQCGWKIAKAMDAGTNNDVAIAIIDYLTTETDNVASNLVQMVIKKDWLKADKGYLICRQVEDGQSEFLTKAPVNPIWSSTYSVATVFKSRKKVQEALEYYQLTKEVDKTIFVINNF